MKKYIFRTDKQTPKPKNTKEKLKREERWRRKNKKKERIPN